jgi:hypothetical protein
MCIKQIHVSKEHEMKSTAQAQNQMIKSNEQNESIEDEEPFELEIDLSNFPSTTIKHKTNSLIESLQELYQDSLRDIGDQITDQMIDNNVLTLNKDKVQDEKIIRSLLNNVDWYNCSWFRIQSNDGLIKFLSGSSRPSVSEEQMIIDDVFEEIRNVFKEDGYYQN